MDNYVELDSINVHAEEVDHDLPTYAFVVYDNEERYAHITDTNYLELSDHFKNCEQYSVESNYDPITLKQSGRPLFLIERIERTHMSNDQAYRMITELKGDRTKQINIIHISGECNTEFDLDMAYGDLEGVSK